MRPRKSPGTPRLKREVGEGVFLLRHGAQGIPERTPGESADSGLSSRQSPSYEPLERIQGLSGGVVDGIWIATNSDLTCVPETDHSLITFQDIPRRHAANRSRLLRHASCTPTWIRA